MLHVEFNHVTNIFSMSIGFMSYVDFKKRTCRPVEFKGPKGTLMLEIRHSTICTSKTSP